MLLNLNARNLTVEELIALDTGRRREREMVTGAIKNRHNVYLHGSRGAGKTFFLRTQAFYSSQIFTDILPLYVPIDIQSRGGPDGGDYALNLLSTLLLTWWSKNFKRSSSDLLRLASLGERAVVDDLRSEQKRFVDLYRIVHASCLEMSYMRTSLFGATAVAKAELKHDDGQMVSRGALLPSEVSAILAEFAELVAETTRGHVVVMLDEIDLCGVSNYQNLYRLCLELFNPGGVHLVVAGSPLTTRDHDAVLATFETAVPLEGLDSAQELASLLGKYVPNVAGQFQKASIEVLFEFFGGHPRMSLHCCDAALQTSRSGKAVSPKLMTRVCLKAQQLQRTILGMPL